jgi:hypothetical protein
MRLLLRFVFPLSVCGSFLNAAGTLPPAGTWKLSSERVIEGNAPSFPEGVVMTLDEASRIAKFDGLVPSSVVGRDRMRSVVSPDGRTLTQDATGVEAESGKPYHYVLVWKKQ